MSLLPPLLVLIAPPFAAVFVVLVLVAVVVVVLALVVVVVLALVGVVVLALEEVALVPGLRALNAGSLFCWGFPLSDSARADLFSARCLVLIFSSFLALLSGNLKLKLDLRGTGLLDDVWLGVLMDFLGMVVQCSSALHRGKAAPSVTASPLQFKPKIKSALAARSRLNLRKVLT